MSKISFFNTTTGDLVKTVPLSHDIDLKTLKSMEKEYSMHFGFPVFAEIEEASEENTVQS